MPFFLNLRENLHCGKLTIYHNSIDLYTVGHNITRARTLRLASSYSSILALCMHNKTVCDHMNCKNSKISVALWPIESDINYTEKIGTCIYSMLLHFNRQPYSYTLTASPCSWDHSNLHDHSASASTHQDPAPLWLSHQLQTLPPSRAHRGHLQWQTWEVDITESGWSTVQQSSKLCIFMHTCVPLYNMHKCHNIAKWLKLWIFECER